MQGRFSTMSDAIIGRIDEMGARIDELESSIGDLMAQAGIDEEQLAEERSAGHCSRHTSCQPTGTSCSSPLESCPRLFYSPALTSWGRDLLMGSSAIRCPAAQLLVRERHSRPRRVLPIKATARVCWWS